MRSFTPSFIRRMLSFCWCVMLITTLHTTAMAQLEPPLSGCDCPTVRVDDEWCAAALVFEGVPYAADTTFAHAAIPPDGRDVLRHVQVRFTVDRVLKGDAPKDVIIRTATHRDNCAYRFIMGQRYMVFAHTDDGALETDQCSHTRALDTISPEYRDSLRYVERGHRWVEGKPVQRPCP